MIRYKRFSLIFLFFLVLGIGYVYAQVPTDGFYIDHVYQNPEEQNEPINIINMVGMSIMLIAVVFVAAYIYQRQLSKLREENKIRKERIEKEG